MRRRYKVSQLMINVLPDVGEGGPGVCRAPSLPDCLDQSLCPPLSLAGCGLSECPIISRCFGVSLPGCGPGTLEAASCQEACVSCTGCSLVLSCGLTRMSHPAVCSAVHLEGLAVLKAQLTQALGQLQERQTILEEAAKPQSLEEVEALEARLDAARDTVRAWKAELEQERE